MQYILLFRWSISYFPDEVYLLWKSNVVLTTGRAWNWLDRSRQDACSPSSLNAWRTSRAIVLSSSELKRIVRLSFEQVPRMNYTPVIYAFQVSQVQSGRICKRSRHARGGNMRSTQLKKGQRAPWRLLPFRDRPFFTCETWVQVRTQDRWYRRLDAFLFAGVRKCNETNAEKLRKTTSLKIDFPTRLIYVKLHLRRYNLLRLGVFIFEMM